jgi:hypothetical protein
MWQRMDTAPKDGTRFRGTDGKSVRKTYWSPMTSKWYWLSINSDKYVGDDRVKYGPWEPTHWQAEA